MELLKKEQIVKEFKMSNATIFRLTKKGLLNPIRFKGHGNRNYYMRTELEKLLNINKIKKNL